MAIISAIVRFCKSDILMLRYQLTMMKIVITFCFLRPDVSFSIRTLRMIPLTEIPFLKTWIYHLVMNGLSEALVDPSKLDFTTTSTGPTKVLSQPQPKALGMHHKISYIPIFCCFQVFLMTYIVSLK